MYKKIKLNKSLECAVYGATSAFKGSYIGLGDIAFSLKSKLPKNRSVVEQNLRKDIRLDIQFYFFTAKMKQHPINTNKV